jgi:MscS family membrane protein
MKKFLLLVLFLSICTNALPGQSIANQLKGVAPPEPATATTDPLGRETPSGTVFGFLQVEQEGNNKAAADYLQLSAVRRQSQDGLASKLKVLMDRAFVVVTAYQPAPGGQPGSWRLGRQTVGTFVSGSEADIPVVLVRVTDPNARKIWLFSYETLSKVPELYDNLQAHQIENRLPRILVGKLFLGLPLWQWIALLIAIPIAAAIGWAIVLMLAVPRRIWLNYTKRPNVHLYVQLSGPLLLFLQSRTAPDVYIGLPLLPVCITTAPRVS